MFSEYLLTAVHIYLIRRLLFLYFVFGVSYCFALGIFVFVFGVSYFALGMFNFIGLEVIMAYSLI